MIIFPSSVGLSDDAESMALEMALIFGGSMDASPRPGEALNEASTEALMAELEAFKEAWTSAPGEEVEEEDLTPSSEVEVEEAKLLVEAEDRDESRPATLLVEEEA